jgi:hypothetical protein
MSEYLTSADIQALYKVSQRTVRRWATRKKNPLPSAKISGAHGPRSYRASEVREWWESQRDVSDGGELAQERKWTMPRPVKPVRKRPGERRSTKADEGYGRVGPR